jgi:hypothetical protein
MKNRGIEIKKVWQKPIVRIAYSNKKVSEKNKK